MVENINTLVAQPISDCPCCGSAQLTFAFERIGKRFLKCEQCHAYCWATPEFVPDVYEDGSFADRLEGELSTAPDYRKFKEFAAYLKPGSLLEIGPGTGAFLAAARERGFAVSGVELSPFHRDYIRRHWNLETLAEPLEESLPGEDLYDNVASFNCIEHVLRPKDHFQAVHRVLKPGGRFVIGTANSDSLCARLVGKWWAMYKQPDHVNIMSARSFKALARATGFTVVAISYGEFPLETPGTLLLSLRDRFREGRSATGIAQSPGATQPNEPVSRAQVVARRLIQSPVFTPVGAAISRLGMGAAVRIVLEKVVVS